MLYVCILNSINFPDRHYTGVTDELRARLKKHNAKEVSHTSKHAPWKLKTRIALLGSDQLTLQGRQAFRDMARQGFNRLVGLAGLAHQADVKGSKRWETILLRENAHAGTQTQFRYGANGETLQHRRIHRV